MEDIKVIPKTTSADIRLPDSSVSYELLPIKSFLGISDIDNKSTDKLSYLRGQFGKEVPLTEVLHQLRQTEIKLGAPRLGETRLDKLYSYFRVTESIKLAEQRRQDMLA